MKKIARYALGALLTVSLFACIKDDEKECNSQVKFTFRYNLLSVDAFHTQADNVDLFLFDENDVFLKLISAEVPADLEDNTFRLSLPNGYSHATQMVAWAGLNEECYNIPKLTEGVSTLDDLNVILSAEIDCEIDLDFDPLLWGYVRIDGGIKYRNETIEIPMIKNTNSFRIVLASSPANPFSLDVDDFSFRFTTPNGSYDYQNDCFDEIDRVYIPHLKENAIPETRSETTMAIAEICTKRLREENVNHLQILHNRTGEPIIDTSLNDFLKKLQLGKHGKYKFQEYLDREDHYGVVIFLDRIIQGGEYHYISSSIYINEWIVREQPVDQ